MSKRRIEDTRAAGNASPRKKSKRQELAGSFASHHFADFSTPSKSKASSSTSQYRNGAICYIELVNFMVHEKFSWRPHPRVNLITGPNGAGKSSILQAIVIGLGAKATETKRSNNSLSQFVRTKQSKAEIRIHLWNGNEDGEQYRHDVYGDEIIFERVIAITDHESKKYTTRQCLRDSNKAVRSQGKMATEERARILDFFMIMLSNPMVILQQEEAKRFFQTLDNRGLYEFFNDASLLKKLRQNNSKNANLIKKTKEEYEEQTKQLNEDKAKLEEVKETLKEFQHFEGNQSKERDKQLTRWAFYKDVAKELQKDEAPQQAKAKSFYEMAVQKYQNAVKKEQEAIKNKEKFAMKFASATDKNDKEQQEYEKIESDKKDLEKRQEDLRKKIAQIRSDKSNSVSVIQRLKNEIIQLVRNNSRVDNDTSNEVLDAEGLNAEAAKLDAEFNTLSAKMVKLGDNREAKNKEMECCESQIKRLLVCKRSLLNKREILQKDLEQATRKNSSISRYGQATERLVNAIEKAVLAKKFQKPPIGPVGCHIRLTDEATSNKAISQLLELEIQSVRIRSFIVDNDADYTVLDGLMQEHFHGNDRGSRQPRIYTRDLGQQRYDVARHGVQSPNPGVKTMLSYLKFTNDDVFNLIVDEVRPESILVCSQALVQQLFSSKSRVPRNTKCAITPDFYRYFPPTDHQDYASYYIPKPKQHLSFLVSNRDHEKQISENIEAVDEEIHDCDRERSENALAMEELKNQHEAIKMELENHQSMVKQLRIQLSQVKASITRVQAQGQSKESLENHIADRQNQIQEMNAKLDELNKEKSDVSKKIEQIKNKFAEKSTSSTDAMKTKAETDKKMDDLLNAIKTAMAEKKSAESFMEEKKAIFDEKEKAFKEKKRIVENAKKDVEENGGEKPGENEMKTFDEMKAKLAEKKKQSTQLERRKGTNIESLEEEHQRLAKRIKKAEQEHGPIQRSIDRMVQEKNKRKMKLLALTGFVVRNIKRAFMEKMVDNNMTGHVVIDAKDKRELIIEIIPSGQQQNGKGKDKDNYVSLTSLSGGERSKTLGCLILAMWHHVMSPFRALDEWDVFLDDKSRGIMEELLVENCRQKPYQNFFISPQNSKYRGKDLDDMDVIELKKPVS